MCGDQAWSLRKRGRWQQVHLKREGQEGVVRTHSGITVAIESSSHLFTSNGTFSTTVVASRRRRVDGEDARSSHVQDLRLLVAAFRRSS